MSKLRGKRTTLTVDRETFEEYFFVGSTGVSVARDAKAADKIRTPYEAIALVCLVNQLEAEWFFWDMVVELEQYGKDDDYIAAHKIGDYARYDSLIFDHVSKDRVHQMLLDVQSDLREELGIPEGHLTLKRVPSLTRSKPDDEDREEPRSDRRARKQREVPTLAANAEQAGELSVAVIPSRRARRTANSSLRGADVSSARARRQPR